MGGSMPRDSGDLEKERVMGALTFSLPGNVPSDYTDLAEVFSKLLCCRTVLTTVPLNSTQAQFPRGDRYIPSQLLRVPP